MQSIRENVAELYYLIKNGVVTEEQVSLAFYAFIQGEQTMQNIVDHMMLQIEIEEKKKAKKPKEKKPSLRLPFSAEDAMALLPTGSGIDVNWACSKETPYTYRFDASYHNMNDGGYYTHWSTISVIIKTARKLVLNSLKGPCQGKTQVVTRPGDVYFTLLCRNEMLKEYLYEIIGESLYDLMTRRNEVVDNDNL